MLLKWCVASTLYVGAWCLILQLQLMITTVQTQAPNESLQCRLRPQMNHYCADSGPKWITTESLLCRLRPQMNHYSADSGPKWITTVQTQAPNESLLCRLRPQMNHYWITTVQIQAPNESLLCRLRPQMNHYCANSGPKLITTVQTWAPN